MRIQRFLLDTHTLLWAVGDKERLSSRALSLLADDGPIPYVSTATAWEIATKYRLGKLPRAGILMDDFAGKVRALGYTFLSATVDHFLLAGSFTMNHKDPFDRLIVAQARIENMPVLSIDAALDQFPIQRIW